MTTINTFQLDATFTQMTIDFDVAATYLCTDLKLYIGDKYLSTDPADYVDLTSLTGPTEHTNILLTPDSPELVGFYTKDVFDGIFTIVITSSETPAVPTGSSIINAYYSSVCLANKILAMTTPEQLNETNLLYLYLDAAITFIASDLIEEALAAYDKVEAICNAAGDIYLETDISPCGDGIGCWIVDGVYVIKR